MNSIKTDPQITRDVRAELRWEPALDGCLIDVQTSGGVVSLSGTVDAFDKKHLAETCAQRVAGVRAVAEEIEVKLPTSRRTSDSALAKAVLDTLRWNASLDERRIRVVVENGVVRLSGTVDWRFQRSTAENAVQSLVGVRGLVNRIQVIPSVKPGDVKSAIERAFERHARLDASRIQVSASGGKVVLAGHVRDWSERDEAERAAWSAPGVKTVEDEIAVG